MTSRFLLIVIFLFLFVLPMVALADSGVLHAVADGYVLQWTEAACCAAGNDYTCLTGDTPQDSSFLYAGVVNYIQTCKLGVPSDTTGDLDSIWAIWRFAEVLSNTDDIRVACYVDFTSGGWGECPKCTTTFENIPTDATTDSVRYTQVCNRDGDTVDVDWFCLTDTAHYEWGIKALTISFMSSVYWYWIELRYFYTPAAEGGALSGGIIQDEDKRGIIEGGIIR